MFERLLGNGIDYDSFDVPAGELPGVPGAHDAYLITGAAAGVYDGLPWIHELAAFLRAAGGAKLVGICFGHQIMAEAFGGRVEKVAKGWGVGLHNYPIVQHEPWMDQATRSSPIPASHQDQVVQQPPQTDVIASSIFTPYAGLAWHDQRAISFQFHPEFEPDLRQGADRMPARAAARSRRAPSPRSTRPTTMRASGRGSGRFLLS